MSTSTWERFKQRLAPADSDRIDWFLSAPFAAIHLTLVAIPWLGFGAREAAVAGVTYAAGMFFVTAGYHRYFSHRSFKTSRAFQLVMAFFAQATVQRGVLWWSGHHRHHHRASDRDDDIHSPRRGLLWSHMGWFLSNRHEEAPLERVRDFASYPELRWLERWYWVPPLVVGAAIYAAFGLPAVVGGYLLGVVVLYHVTFTINSLAHRWGRQRFPTGDDSRNNALLALLTFGEGWHNNHHYCPSSVRQGFRWWEVDLTYYALRALAALGVVWDLKPIPRYARAEAARHHGAVARAQPAPAAAGWPGGRRVNGGASMRRVGQSLALVLAMLLPADTRAADSSANGVFRYRGVARSPGGALLYRETHEERYRDGRLQRVETRYFAPNGKRIATLRSDFRRSLRAPDYRFVDHRTGAVESARLVRGAVILRDGDERERVGVPSGPPLVLGQGLHHFARARLATLARRAETKVRFAIPSRMDTYVFRVRPLAAPRPGVVRLRIEIDSWVLRLLAPSLEVDYDAKTRRLLVYRGVSNLTDDSGDTQKVVIRYRYDR